MTQLSRGTVQNHVKPQSIEPFSPLCASARALLGLRRGPMAAVQVAAPSGCSSTAGVATVTTHHLLTAQQSSADLHHPPPCRRSPFCSCASANWAARRPRPPPTLFFAQPRWTMMPAMLSPGPLAPPQPTTSTEDARPRTPARPLHPRRSQLCPSLVPLALRPIARPRADTPRRRRRA